MTNEMVSQTQKTIEGKIFSCPKCNHQEWVYIDDIDNGDWVEATYKCNNCGHIEYVELAD